MSLSAAHVAVAKVTACKLYGVAPGEAFEPVARAPKARLAAGGACSRLGLASRESIAGLFRLTSPNQLAPSQLAARGIVADDLAAIVRALKEAGLVQTSVPLPSAPEAADAPSRDKADTPVEAPAEPVPVRRAGKGWARRGARSGGERAVGGGGRWSGPRDGIQKRVITRHGPDTARPSASPIEAARGAVRLKPVTDRIVRWAGFFPPECWSHDEIAALFDVHPDALLDALDPPLAGEAA